MKLLRQRRGDGSLTFDERLEMGSFFRVAIHHVRVDPQGEPGISVADLGHYRDRILSAGDQHRRERVSQLVSGERFREGNLSIGDE